MKRGLEENLILQGLSRRDFLSTLAIAGAASFLPFYLTGCSKNSAEYTGTGKVPFKVWEEMLQAIMTSPDYLPGRMEQLIAGKDPEAMYHFVKDEIVLIPPKSHRLTGLGTSFRWGIPGVLRCGMATPREKAELLNVMYQKAGIESKVVFERTNIKPEEVPAFFYRPVIRNFDPEISKSQFKSWEKEMGYSEEVKSRGDIQKDYTGEANALGDKILKEIDYFDKYAKSFDFRWDNYQTPTVEFIQEEKTKYAHLFDPEIPFGSLKNDNGGKTSPADPVKENEEEIAIKLSYRNNIKPDEEMELVSGKWKATDLIGKQILIQFLHGLRLEEQVVTPIGNVRTFTPALALQSIDESEEYMSERSFLGDPITIDGKRIKIDEQGKTSIDDNILLNKANSGLQKKVTDLAIKASVAGYPIVKVNIIAKDGPGNFVEGLSPKDFVFTEDGKPVSALMENNQRTPKILVLSDASFSMPKEYYNEGMKEFNEKLKNNILEKYPSAILTFWETPSSLFTWLLKASQTSYDLIIYATDGDNDDSYDDNNYAIHQAGPPALILNVNNSTWKKHVETFDKMAEITNGMVINVKNRIKVLEEIIKKIDALGIPPYVFSYASTDKSREHTVKVNIDKNRLDTEDTYQFPETAKRVANGIIGIYLEIRVGKNKPVKRVLAGWDHKYEDYNFDNGYALKVEGLFFGGAMLAVEGEGPTFSMALSDLLKSKLSNRNWGEALHDGDIKKAKKEIQKGILTYPAMFIPLMAPLQNLITNDSLTFPSGYRMCLLKTSIGINTNPNKISFDYLPTSNYVTMSSSKIKAFTINLSKTSQLAVRENYLFDQNTYALLEQTILIERTTAISEKWRKKTGIQNDHIDFKYWNEKVFRGDLSYKVFDSEAKSKAFWKINQYTGEMYGILPNGTGGGWYQYDPILEQLSSVLKAYAQKIKKTNPDMKKLDALNTKLSKHISIVPLSPVVRDFGITLVRKFAFTTVAINIMDGNIIEDEEIRKAFQIMACKVTLEIPEKLPGSEGVMPGVDRLIGLITDNNLPC